MNWTFRFKYLWWGPHSWSGLMIFNILCKGDKIDLSFRGVDEEVIRVNEYELFNRLNCMQKKSKYTKELVLQACRNTKQERLEIQAAKNAVVVVVVIAVVLYVIHIHMRLRYRIYEWGERTTLYTSRIATSWRIRFYYTTCTLQIPLIKLLWNIITHLGFIEHEACEPRGINITHSLQIHDLYKYVI